jgi:hypothetical protein
LLKLNSNYSLFAAQTLKHKIVLDWRQLDDSMVLGLRETLWFLIFSSPSTSPAVPHTVSVQLKLALAALIVQIPVKLWIDPVADLFSLVQQNPQTVSAVLEVLAMIPEQLSNRSIQFQSNDIYYQKCSILLEKHIDNLIEMVLKVLQSPLDDRLKVSKDLLACLLAWIQFGGNGSKIIETPEFLDGLFNLLHSSCSKTAVHENEEEDEEEEHLQIVETCCELLVELIIRMSGKIEDWDDNQQGEEVSSLTHGSDWFNRLGQIWIPTLSTNLARLPIIKSLQLRKEQLQRPLISLLCEAMELFLSSLMDRTDEFFKLCETVLAVAELQAIPSNILELTFNFWAALPVELTSFNESKDVETRQGPFIYLFSRLFTALLRGPLIFKTGGSAEDIDKFREFRHVVGDCLKDCVRVLGSTEALLLINSQLTAQIPLIQREAALFALRTVSSSVDPRETEAMPLIAPLLLNILLELLQNESTQPIEHQSLKMISAVVLNVGCYSEWLRYHSEFMGTFLQILSLSLDYASNGNGNGNLEKSSTVIGSSLQSLKYMCESCAGLLGSQYPALEGLFTRVYPWSGLCRRDRLDLTEAVSLVLSRRSSWSDDEFLSALNRVLILIWNGGPGCLEDYAVVLECIMLPEIPRTPLIFSQVFIPSFSKLAEIFSVQQFGKTEEEEKFCEAWLRVILAALNNGTAGAVGDFSNGHLAFWLQEKIVGFSNLSAIKQATLFSLTSSMISGQFLVSPDNLVLGLLKDFPMSATSELWTSERCNLMRVCIIYVFSRVEMIQEFLVQSKTFEMLNMLLNPQRTLSSVEIIGLCGFLAALFGSLQEEVLGESGMTRESAMDVFLEGVLTRICEAALLEWPLTHVNDLAMLLSKSARDTSMLKQVTWSLFDFSTPANLLITKLFPVGTSTTAELTALAHDYHQALTAACKNYRPKNLRAFLKGVAETCRRRRGHTNQN